MTPPLHEVIVIGAGYAGVRGASAAARRADTLLIEADGHHDFGPRLAMVPASDARAEVGTLLDVPLVTASVTRIDPVARRVELDDGRSLGYAALVVTSGSRAATPEVPGLEEHALTLKSAEDALAIRESLAGTRSLVIVGGGPTGVQLAGEVAIAWTDTEVHLLEAEPRLLPSFPRSLGEHAARLLRDRSVHVHLGAPAERIDDGGVRLADGSQIDGLVVWAGGFEPTGHDLLPDLPTEDGRIVVEDDLSVRGMPGVFVAGDSAAHRDVLGRLLPMSAQVAEQAGRVAGDNAGRIATGRATRSARLFELGWVIPMGQGRGVARVGPLRLDNALTDRLVPLLHHVIDLRHLWYAGGLTALGRHAEGMPPDESPDDA